MQEGVIMVMFLRSHVNNDYEQRVISWYLRGSKPINSLTFASSSSGLGPRPSCDMFDEPAREEGCGVPDREG